MADPRWRMAFSKTAIAFLCFPRWQMVYGAKENNLRSGKSADCENHSDFRIFLFFLLQILKKK